MTVREFLNHRLNGPEVAGETHQCLACGNWFTGQAGAVCGGPRAFATESPLRVRLPPRPPRPTFSTLARDHWRRKTRDWPSADPVVDLEPARHPEASLRDASRRVETVVVRLGEVRGSTPIRAEQRVHFVMEPPSPKRQTVRWWRRPLWPSRNERRLWRAMIRAAQIDEAYEQGRGRSLFTC